MAWEIREEKDNRGRWRRITIRAGDEVRVIGAEYNPRTGDLKSMRVEGPPEADFRPRKLTTEVWELAAEVVAYPAKSAGVSPSATADVDLRAELIRELFARGVARIGRPEKGG